MQRGRRDMWALKLMLLIFGGVVASLLSAEAPRGQLQGTLVAADTGNPLSHIKVSLISTEGRLIYRTRTDGQGRFFFRHIRAGTYVLVADTQAHESPDRKIVIEEGQLVSASFELQPTEPFLHIIAPQRVFTTQEEIAFRCYGFVRSAVLTVRAYRIDDEVAIRAWDEWLPGELGVVSRNLSEVNLESLPSLTLAARKEAPIIGRDVEGVFRQKLAIEKLPPGMYLLSVDAGQLRVLQPFVVTDLALVAKASGTQLLVYATDIEEGRPLANVEIEVTGRQGLISKGRTNSRGLLQCELSDVEQARPIRVVGRRGGAMAVAQLWPYESEPGKGYRVYIYTDRPVYRPGQTVYFKGIVRQIQGQDYVCPEPMTARVRVVDDEDDLIYSGSHQTNAFGSLHGRFQLPTTALPGRYTVSVFCGGRPHEGSFWVAEYRKPEFEVSVDVEKPRYVRGETIRATVTATYYYGAPVSGGKVEWYVTKSEYWYWPEVDEWDADVLQPFEAEAGETIVSGTGVLDEAGKLTISIPGELMTEVYIYSMLINL